MTDKLELKSSYEVVYTVNVEDVESIFYCKPTDPDILTVLMKDGKRLYCDEVCPLQEEPVSNNYSALLPCIYNRTLEERIKYCKYCSAACEGRVKEPVSEELEEEIDNYVKRNGYDGLDSIEEVKYIANHFAKWQKEQMIKDATDAVVHIDAGGYPYISQLELYDYDRDVPLAKEGDKYKVVLIKEE